MSDNCADCRSYDAIGNLVDYPIRQYIPDFGLPIIRPNDGYDCGQYTGHTQGGGDHSNPSHLTGEYDDSLARFQSMSVVRVFEATGQLN